MRYYATKTFKLRNDKDSFDYFCSYCGAKADYKIESDDRDAVYHYFCGACVLGSKHKSFLDSIFMLENEISKNRAKIDGLKINESMVKAREYENKLRRLNAEYFGGDDD